MVYVGIDVAKDKHACCILDDDGNRLGSVLEVSNNLAGFGKIAQAIEGFCPDKGSVRVALESTGHYAFNLLSWLLDKGYQTFVLNPLLTAQYHKSQSLRKTKTDRVDSATIAELLRHNEHLIPYSKTSIRLEELKILTRYRFDLVHERARLKSAVARLVNILFPELEEHVSDLHLISIYELLVRYPGARQIAAADPEEVRDLLIRNSHGHINYGRATAILEAAQSSIGSDMASRSMELRHTITQIRGLSREIDEIEAMIGETMAACPTHITSIPGIGVQTGAMILGEIQDIHRFSRADKLLAYAGLSPTVYQSGKINNLYAHMDKVGSRYLRCAFYTAAKYVCKWDPVFHAYLMKKIGEGKHYNVAISHAAKKLVRLIYSMEMHDREYDAGRLRVR